MACCGLAPVWGITRSICPKELTRILWTLMTKILTRKTRWTERGSYLASPVPLTYDSRWGVRSRSLSLYLHLHHPCGSLHICSHLQHVSRVRPPRRSAADRLHSNDTALQSLHRHCEPLQRHYTTHHSSDTTNHSNDTTTSINPTARIPITQSPSTRRPKAESFICRGAPEYVSVGLD